MSFFFWVFDILLSIEVIAILFFNSDAFGVVPEGATHTEAILFAIGLWIISEIYSLKYYAFGTLGKDK